MTNKDKTIGVGECPILQVLAIKDTLNVISGKWKIPIIATLRFKRMRFNEIKASIPKITPRMLSKELKELELNGILKKSVFAKTQNVIRYELTESGRKLTKVAEAMIEWGMIHRKSLLGTNGTCFGTSTVPTAQRGE